MDNEKIVTAKILVDYKLKRLKEATETSDKGEITRARHELGANYFHVKFLEFLTNAAHNTLYILPHCMMNMFQLDDRSHSNFNIFEHYELLELCSYDVLQEILRFSDEFDTGLMKICLYVSGDCCECNAVVFNKLVKIEPNHTVPTTMSDEGIDFYTGRSCLLPNEVAYAYEDDEGNYHGKYYASVLWIKRRQ